MSKSNDPDDAPFIAKGLMEFMVHFGRVMLENELMTAAEMQEMLTSVVDALARGERTTKATEAFRDAFDKAMLRRTG